MQMPRTLRNYNVFVDGHNYAGVAEKLQLPKIKRKTDGHRGAGMLGEVDLGVGYEKLEAEVTYTGFDVNAYRTLKRCGIDGLPVRFVGSYTQQDTCDATTVEVYMRGSAMELDPGDAELGKKGETKVKYGLTYYKLVVNGRTEIELDFINGIEVIAGEDLMSELRNLLGL